MIRQRDSAAPDQPDSNLIHATPLKKSSRHSHPDASKGKPLLT
jgi:hypothetical protein